MPQLNTSSVNSQADNIAADYGSAVLTIYSGTPPVDANAALSGNTVIVNHTVAGFASAVAGVITAAAIADSNALAAGTATFARLVQAGNTMQVTLGTSGAELIVTDTAYLLGELSKINSLVITQPAT